MGGVTGCDQMNGSQILQPKLKKISMKLRLQARISDK